MSRELIVDSYNYHLPKELIATYPKEPRDSAKLLIYDRVKDRLYHSIFRDIEEFIPKDTQIVLNNTKVIKARIFGKKESGGRVELLLNRELSKNQFSAFIRGRVKIGSQLKFEQNLRAKILKLLNDGSRIVQFTQNERVLNFPNLIEILNEIGKIPLPPYIDREAKESDEREYQSLFAKEEGAVAAPTASLHFSKELFESIQRRFNIEYITLHIGAGTFKPVESKDILEHKMHSEIYSISESTKKLIESESKILAVGTTVTRAIEFYVREKLQSGECNLFLNPKNRPQRVDYLLTNFHLPKSTLIMLVASFIGLDKTMQIYKEAIEQRYRFYSYGDAMLII